MEYKEIQLVTKTKGNSINNKTLNQTFEEILPATAINKRLLDLEGECKIKSFQALQVDWLKTILLIFPIIASGIGLLLLKYYKSFRVAAFFKKCSHDEADYFFIESQDHHQDIEATTRSKDDVIVYFKNLKYKLVSGQLCPVGYQFEEVFQSIRSKDYFQRGVTQSNIQSKVAVYGLNEHKVEIPNYFQYMFQVLTKPFFLMQYVIIIILIFQNLLIFVYLYIAFSVTTTTINYLLLYTSFLKIKEIAEKQHNIRVIRNGSESIVLSHQLVPGDVVIPLKDDEMAFDGLLMQGEVFVNEASLTGQSIPIGKFAAQDLLATKQENTWLFEGSKVLESRPNTRVIVVNTGYATRRGRIIRKILSRTSKMPEFFTKGVIFLLQAVIVGVILYLATLPLMIGKIVDQFVGFRFLDVLGWTFPPSFPIYFNLAFTYSLFRLKNMNIYGTQPQKTTEAADIRTFCFDKTGTLTQNEIQVYEITKFANENTHANITKGVEDPSNKLIFKLFASCHTVRQVENSYLGDQVDLRMYLHSGYKMSVPSTQGIRFVVEDGKGEKLEVLRINQFESKFQNMSVLIRDVKQQKYFVFVKGAPERIERNSIFKFKEFESMVASFSLGGYRTIAYGYREVSKEQLKAYLQGEREIFQKDIIALGLVAFQNKLKPDTRDTIDRLILSDIEPKMITGDNIYIAVETGFRAGIIRPGEKVLLLQGRKQTNMGQANRIFKGITIEKQGDEIVKRNVQLSQNEDYLSQTQYALAIDNDFLTMQPEPVLTRTTKLFARISPENKAKIVKRYIQQQQQQFDKKSGREKFFGKARWRVGMCGDGANDLMAIREADVGLGISDSDASYGAAFTISRMLDVEHIVRQSKNCSQSIIDMICYFGSTSFIKVITSILMISDVTYFGPFAMVYFNFAHNLFLATFMGLSSPEEEPTKKRPDTNMLSLKNHFYYWINVILPSAGIILAYIYFIKSQVFIPNVRKEIPAERYRVACQTQTIMFLMINLPFICNAFICYTSKPYRKPIYDTKVLLITIVGNLIAAIVIFFFPTHFPANFFFVNIPELQAGIVLLIVGVSIILTYIAVEVFKRNCAEQ